ncbi:nuclear transport factor 2 family protein [Parahaliea aestuarii]|uniref:Nuclear transport factor 2 family protein n=1 Tax=Parahaliea aestuarii TaxID=1852021 RepID=A0A5C8ZVC6_9GAMM|nr:nuclear transport factor 2 family protein [Parahaliea aestuarii]TXS91530.1 nuclear transport factor 2 family protein [Parahaliea aestuarii]
MDTDIPRLLAARYAKFVDDREFSRMAEIMTPDFTQKGPGFGAGSLQEFITNLEFLRQYSATLHMVGNQVGEWHNAIYTGETWCVASHIYEKDGVARKLDMGIRYRDVIEEAGGNFRYTSRDLNVVWTQDLPCQG